MPETRSVKSTTSEGVENAQEISLADIIKEKLNEFKDELLTEIKLLIKSEVDEALKKQKEEFDSAFSQWEWDLVDVDYVFTDVNCWLKVVFKGKRSSFLNVLMIWRNSLRIKYLNSRNW